MSNQNENYFLNSGDFNCVFLMPNQQIWRVSKLKEYPEDSDGPVNPYEGIYKGLFNEAKITTVLRKIDPMQSMFVSYNSYEITTCKQVQHMLGKEYSGFKNALETCKQRTSSFKTCTSHEPFKMVISKTSKILVPVQFKDKHDMKDKLHVLKKNIKFLHKHHIVHGDLHVGNIMMDPRNNNNLVIIDWEKAYFLSKVTDAYKAMDLEVLKDLKEEYGEEFD